jgi:site-specific DNA-cytosine methylase
MALQVLELFAGIGGMSLGLERAGMHVVGQVEIEPFNRKILHKQWPEVQKHDDVRTAIDWWVSEPRPRVDVIAGGYPCQGESQAGRRLGEQDERWLWPEMARIIDALHPRWVIGENVAGHRTKGLRFVLRDLEQLGYAACAGTIRACDLGAPHQRKRIFVVANSLGIDLREQPWRRCWEGGEGAAIARDDGEGGTLADADGEAGRSEAGDAESGACGEAVCGGAAKSGRCGGDVADASSTGLERHGREHRLGEAIEEGQAAGASWWAAESGLGRGADGVPSGLDSGLNFWASGAWEEGIPRVAPGVPNRIVRLRGIGNAVVPQVAQHMGQIVMRADALYRSLN